MPPKTDDGPGGYTNSELIWARHYTSATVVHYSEQDCVQSDDKDFALSLYEEVFNTYGEKSEISFMMKIDFEGKSFKLSDYLLLSRQDAIDGVMDANERLTNGYVPVLRSFGIATLDSLVDD
ncbi:hypothetical protein GOV11_00640 [Candidatus Woesearchaeota archaeon]|nr:hypothetical protein [Candidatus Woesearchaeota archaeon]